MYVNFLKETHAHTRVDIYNSFVHLIYMILYTATHVYLLVYVTVVFATCVCLLKMSKKYIF